MRILVADDDPTLRMLMREILQVTMECEVVEASNGEEAWNLLIAGAQVDLCILDMRMPRLGGVELVGRMRSDERFRNQRVMVCSGVNERAPILEAVSAGIDGYLLKPFVGDALQSQVRKILKRPTSVPPTPALIPMRDILKKLGTKKETYVRLLKTFTMDVSDVLTLVKGSWTTELRQEASVRLLSIQGSGTTLGAELVVNRALSLEQSLAKNEVSAKASKIAALDVENRRVIVATDKILSEPEPVVELSPYIPEVGTFEQPPEASMPSIDFLKGDSQN